uniref:Uncharacterized protein n=1 Tax=Tanacetum cinerariifolium TaxID=118510 RepID=A0A6L2KJT9_TANCI|nr:hypothetical protein [Tanacetum cinerariifolium]
MTKPCSSFSANCLNAGLLKRMVEKYLEEGATESLKATKDTKPKATKATKPAGDKASTLTSTQPAKPKPAPTQPSQAVPEKKQKLVKETPDEPSPAKRSKAVLVGKIRKPKSPLKEPDSGRIQPLLDVQGKVKEKVIDEQAAHNILTLLTPKNKSPVDQFIFQRRTPILTEAFRHVESPSLDTELPLTDSETESDNVASKIDTRDQDEGQTGPNLGDHDKGPAGQNPVIPEEPASSTRTLPSLQNLKKELSFTDQFFVEKQQKEEPVKTNAKTETSQSGSPLPTSTATTSAVMTTTTIPPPPPQPQQSTINPTLVKRIDELEQHMANLLQYNLALEESDLPTVDMKEILQQQMFEDKSYEAHEDYKKLYDVLENTSGSAQQQGSKASTGISRTQELSTTDSLIQDDSIPDEQERPATPKLAWTIPSSTVLDVENNWAIALVLAYETPTENSLLVKTGDRMNFVNCILTKCHSLLVPDGGVSQDAHRSSCWTNPEGDQVRIDVNRPLPLGGSSGHVTIQTQFFFNKDLEYLRYGSKGSSLALSISKMKAASYPDFGLELLVSEQMWIDDVHASPSRRKKSEQPCGFSVSSKLKPTLDTGHLNHLPGSDKRMLSTTVKLWTRNLVIR